MKRLVIPFMSILFANQNKAQNRHFSDQLLKKEIKENGLSAICYQDIRRNPRLSTIDNSTSFFISKNCLLTSAHNVTKLFLHNVNNITIFPMRIGDEKEFDSIYLTVSYNRNIRYPDAYKFNSPKTHPPFDFALIFIPDNIINNNPKLNAIKQLPLVQNPETLKIGDTVYCAGYPAEGEYNGEYIMTMDTSIVERLYDGYFTHGLATLQGNSGSPILIKRENKFFVIGINSIGHSGTWLDSKKQTLIRSWIKSLEQENNNFLTPVATR